MLDLGCGNAVNGRWLRGQCQYVDIDVSFTALNRAICRPVSLVCGDADSLPFRDEAFDGVIATYLFVGSPHAPRYQLTLFRWLLEHPCFGQTLLRQDRDLLYGKLLEDTMIECLKEDEHRWAGFRAGIQIWWLLGRQGILPGWKHLAAPLLCLVGMKKRRR